MTSANKEALLISVASVCMLVSVFGKPLGIPEDWQVAPMLVGAIMFLLVIRLRKKTKIERERTSQPAPVVPLARRKKVFWMVALILIAGSVGMLPTLPYTVENFHPWIFYYVIPAQVLFLAFLLSWYWKKMVRADATGPDDDAQK